MTTLFSTQEIASVQSSTADTMQSVMGTVLEAGYKVTLLNLEMARNAINLGAAGAMAGLNDEARTAAIQPLTREVATYCRNLAHITAETQVEIARQVQSHTSDFSKAAISLLDRAAKSDGYFGSAVMASAMKSALATATTSCQSLAETAKRITELAEANANALADTVQSMSNQQQPTPATSYKQAA